MPKRNPAPLPEDDLVLRIRDLLHRRGITERRMFGGTCFMVNGNMIGGVTPGEDLALRVGPEAYEECLAHPDTREMDFTKRPMKGFVYVDRAALEDDAALKGWVERGWKYARSLPGK